MNSDDLAQQPPFPANFGRFVGISPTQVSFLYLQTLVLYPGKCSGYHLTSFLFVLLNVTADRQ